MSFALLYYCGDYMELILNTNNLGYRPFLESNIDSLIIGLKNFCVNQQFSVSLRQLPKIINEIRSYNKKIYLSINIFANEKETSKLTNIINKLVNLDIDGFIVSDLGVLNILKSKNLESKVTLDLQTYVTNMYSAKALLNFGVNRVCLSKEITLEDIKVISKNNEGKIELLAQGYYPITYSRRPILSCYLKNFKIKKNSNLYYIKEETRDNYYLLEQKNNLSVFNDSQYSLLCYLKELYEANIKHLRIDSIFLSEKEIIKHINSYSSAISYLKDNNTSDLEKLYKKYKQNPEYQTPFLHNESILLKEGNK